MILSFIINVNTGLTLTAALLGSHVISSIVATQIELRSAPDKTDPAV